jgi:ABC-type nickel/cobalt efflux system permease component RcnA
MLSLHPAFQGLIAISAFVVVALGIWIVFARWGSRPGDSTPPGLNAAGAGHEDGDLQEDGDHHVDSRLHRSETQAGAVAARRG